MPEELGEAGEMVSQPVRTCHTHMAGREGWTAIATQIPRIFTENAHHQAWGPGQKMCCLLETQGHSTDCSSDPLSHGWGSPWSEGEKEKSCLGWHQGSREQDKPCIWSPRRGTAVMDEPPELSYPFKGTGGISAVGTLENKHPPAAFACTQWGLGVTQAMRTSSYFPQPAARHLPCSSWKPIPGVCAVPRQGGPCKSWEKPRGGDPLLQPCGGSPLCDGSPSCCHGALRVRIWYTAWIEVKLYNTGRLGRLIKCC